MKRYVSFAERGEEGVRQGLEAWVPGRGGEAILRMPTASITIYGTSGDDVINGSSDSDYLTSGDGGSDRITAGGGNDDVTLFQLDAGDFLDGGQGNDYLELYAAGTTDPILASGGEVFLGGVLVATSFESMYIEGGLGDDTLIGGSSSGGDGDDTLILVWEGGLLFGDGGNDTLIGGTGWEDLRGGSGNDLLDTGEGGGRAMGETGDDTMKGGGGDDFLDGGTGSDQITGGAGDDGIHLEYLGPGDFAEGGEGTDTLWLNANNVTGSIRVSDGQLFLDGILYASGFELFEVTTGIGRDILIGGTERDIFQMSMGGGRARGGAGNDSLLGGFGFERLFGGDGDDWLDTAEGGGLARGGAGDDRIFGGIGEDRLGGGNGRDDLTGGAGADIFEFEVWNDAAMDIVNDFKVDLDRLVLHGLTITSIEVMMLDLGSERDSLVHLSNGATIGLLGVHGVTADDLL